MRRVAFLATVMVTVSLAVLVGGALHGPTVGSDRRPGSPLPGTAVTELLQAGMGGADAAALVRGLETEVADGAAAERLTLLGLAYQQRARETGGSGLLRMSERALRRALRSRPDDVAAVGGLGSLALARHRFRGARPRAPRTAARTRLGASPTAIVGDALVELGRYRRGVRAVRADGRAQAEPPSYARIAYARELHGRPRRARSRRCGSPSDAPRWIVREPTAWARVELGEARARSRPAAQPPSGKPRSRSPRSPATCYALEQLARIEAAQRPTRARDRLARSAADAIPLPQFVGLLGDLLDAPGAVARRDGRRRGRGAIERLLGANGVRTDLETAVFDARPRHPARARRSARAPGARAERPSIYGDDALGWALARNGRCEEALAWSRRALRLGTRTRCCSSTAATRSGCAGQQAAARTGTQGAGAQSALLGALVARREGVALHETDLSSCWRRDRRASC